VGGKPCLLNERLLFGIDTKGVNWKVKKIGVTVLLLGAVMLMGCGSGEQAKVQTQQKPKDVAPLIQSSKDKNVQLFAATDGVKVDINGKEKTFKWTFIRHIGTDPQVFYTDVTGDGKEEAVIIIQTGRGTGMDNYDIHVLNAADLSEVKVQGYEEIAKKKLDNRVEKKGDGTLDIFVKVQGKETNFNYGFDPAPQYNQDELYFGGVTVYSLENQLIKLSLPGSVGVSPTYVCDFNITYAYDADKNELIADLIEVKPISL
jgi:hypothetical protein